MMSKKFRRFAVLAVLVLGLAACTERPTVPVAQGPLTVEAPPAIGRTTFPLAPGDEITVTVFGQADLSGVHIIPGDGVISIPLVGTVVAGGQTVEKIEQNITQTLSQGILQNPSVSVRVTKYRQVAVIGGVNRPGSLDFQPGMRVINAVALAGDFSPEAILTKPPFIIRAGVKQIATVSDVIYPGDIIEIPANRVRR